MITIKTDDRPIKVFRKDREYNGSTFATYSIGIGSKKQDGSWDNGFQPVKFKKGVELQNKSEITISNAFPTVRMTKDGNGIIEWMITDFAIVNAPAPVQQTLGADPVANAQNQGWMNLDGAIAEELPFA